ncbi:transporter substrate-binding domain-containing protein [Vogesella sp. DC21W]|uniref:Transporter substrate-binding domain-containing protein n=1 Tax=Vogesella aquatica TaxID=2984206 RepID=A0ABT5IVK2_9NEIS|nr:transporter substrate-binding domain-containing protein [Vogesella aquatica]MDC7716596.1 transporter substrate-binding domain-containing protein [Vogesella aquatica]
MYSDIEVAPYQMGNGPEVPEAPGAMVEMLQQAGRDMGLEVVLQRAPQLRGFKSMQAGEVDGAFMFSFVPERQEFGSYPFKDGKPDESARLLSLSYVFYKRKGSPFQWDGSTMRGLEGRAIGYNTTFSVGAMLTKAGLPTEHAKTMEQNFQKLLLGRIAAFAMQEDVADGYIEHMRLQGVEKVPIPWQRKPYYLMLSHQFVERNPALAEKLWAHIGKLRKERLPELVRKYASQPWGLLTGPTAP